jgi:hypothetical protein
LPKISKGIGRGGARPGSGRKQASEKLALPVKIPPAKPTASGSLKVDITAAAKSGALKAIERLNKIVSDGSASDAIRASDMLFKWGFVSPANAKADAAAERYTPTPTSEPAPQPLGKKEQRQANADQSTADGKFAVPQPPRLVVSNQ